MDRRKRQFRLFLTAVVLAASALSILTVLFLQQDRELSEQRAVRERTEAVEQARRELAGRLDAIQLGEINRRMLALESAKDDRPSDPAIVLVTVWGPQGMALPWDSARKQVYSRERFVSFRETGELLEFQSNDPSGAANAYRSALTEARQPEEACDARLALSRASVKAGKLQEASEIYRDMLSACESAVDESGMPFALYAADRLIRLKLDGALASDYLTRLLQRTRLRPLPEAMMIRSLMELIGDNAPEQARKDAAAQIPEIQQVLKLSREFPRIQSLADKEWAAYGAEPWLVKVSPAVSPLPPLVFVVSSQTVAPPGTKLTPIRAENARSQTAPTVQTLTPGFAGLQLEFDATRTFSGGRAPAYLYVSGLVLILVLTILSGYLLLHGVKRDLQMAEMRSHFVASVSHELKTPLTAIRAFSETLALGRMPDEQTRTEYVETILSESERLTRLVDNVLDFSKIELGKKIYRIGPTSLAEVVRSASRAMQYPLAQQGFNLNVSVDEHLPPIAADADALEQAILNLLSNAMKYSGESRDIDLRCSSRNGAALISVNDRGIGIAPSEQPRIFEKFYRVPSAHSKLIAGTGLGLTLVKHIVEAHRGSIEVQSEPGRGSTFTIRIPVMHRGSA